MTYDNGMEMANHKWLANNTGWTSFLLIPTLPGKEELTRIQTDSLRFFPKGTDFNAITAKQLFEA